MNWTITVHHEKDYLEVVTSGCADPLKSLAMAKDISQRSEQNQTHKILIDHLGITSICGHVVDVYNRPKQLDRIKGVRKARIAEVVNMEHLDFFSFFETVCVNQGYDFRIFSEKECALKWLLD